MQKRYARVRALAGVVPALIALALGLGATVALAWDAGPKQCRLNECTGGVTPDAVLDTQPRYASSVLPTDACAQGTEWYGSACYKSCAAGWHRTAVCTCKKDGGGLFDLWTDCGKFGAAGTPAKVCPAGREYWGGLCYSACPAGSVRTAVSTCQHEVKWRTNTHLWVVNRAIDLLASSGDAAAVKISNKLRSGTCLAQWQGGLWDADDGELSEQGGNYGGHFYNAAGKDFTGNATTVVTYMAGTAEKTGHGNARTNANAALQKAGKVSTDAECYQLGLALHFLTDLTQPMHSSSFSALQVPLMLHPAFEDYVGNIQSRFPVTNVKWDKRWITLSPDAVAQQTALRGNTWAPKLADALKYTGTLCTMTSEPGITYTGRCFVNDPGVITRTGEILQDAYQDTASYLYVALKDI